VVPDLQPYTSAEHQPFCLGDGPSQALLIHGFPGTPAEMRPLGDILTRLGWHVRAPLLPGFGVDIVNLNLRRRSDWIESAVQAWHALQADNQASLIVGYSMGAALAVHIAAKFQPERLVLISPFWRAPGVVPLLVPLARFLAPNLRPFKKADFSDPRLRQMFATIVPDANLDDPQVQDFIRTRFTLPLAAMQEVLRLGRGAYRLASKIHSTTLIVQGTNDPIVRPAETRRLLKRMSKAQIAYREINAGHDLLATGTIQFSQLAEELTAFAGQDQPVLPFSVQAGLAAETLAGISRR
jgi:carboxylesterase